MLRWTTTLLDVADTIGQAWYLLIDRKTPRCERAQGSMSIPCTVTNSRGVDGVALPALLGGVACVGQALIRRMPSGVPCAEAKPSDS
jgi:hypothetical protein